MKCLNNRRVLVVDDQEVIHYSFRAVFGALNPAAPRSDATLEGYEVDYATSGEAALEIVQRGTHSEEPHALAFVDMYMPQGWDGVETITRLWEVASDLQIVLCTAFTDYSWSQIITRLGRTDQLLILKKPFDKIEVRQLARALTEKWRLSRQLQFNLANLEDMVAARTSELAQANTRLVELNRELAAARDAAEAASRAKTEFLANISHEIRTPMTSILGFSELLLEPECPISERISSVSTIRRNADQLLAMIDDILDISKLESGRLTVEFGPVAPRELALEISSLLHVRAEEKKLKFAIEFQSTIPQTIETDRRRVRQILLNVVGNAIKFTDSGEVRLSVKIPASSTPEVPQVVFEISDTGVGMTTQQMQTLFDCFNQADMSATRRHRGIGLGLAISLRLARMLGGDITVTSEQSAGSTFRVILPAKAPPAARTAAAASTAAGSVPASPAPGGTGAPIAAPGATELSGSRSELPEPALAE